LDSGGEERIGEGNLGDAALRPAFSVFVSEGEKAKRETWGADEVGRSDEAVGNKPFGSMRDVA